MKKEIYVATKQHYTFMVPKFGKDGKPVMKVNRATGMEFPVMESVMFNPVATKSDMFNLNYMSMFEVTEETPKHVAVRVRELAESPEVTDVITYDDHEARKNPDKARIREQLESTEQELADAKGTIATQNDVIAEMNRRIAELGGEPAETEKAEKVKGKGKGKGKD